MFKKRLFIIVSTLVLIFSMALLTGCNGTSNGNAKGKTTLELWAGGQWTGHDAKNLQKFIDEYNADPNQKSFIKLSIKAEFEQSFATALLVGRQPDIVIWDRFNTPTYAAQDFLFPIDELIAKDNVDKNIFHEEAYNELSFAGKQYGLPLDLDIWGIYVNNQMLNDYNAKNPNNKAVLPTTWDELLDTAQKLTVRQGNTVEIAGYSSQDLYEHFFKYLISTGTEFMGEDGYPNYNTKEVRDTLTFFKTLYNANVSSFATSSKEAFKNGKLAMLNQPIYYSSYLKTYAPDLDYTFIPQPAYTGENGVQGGMIGGFGLALPNAIENYRTQAYYDKQALAWEFMKYWLCSETVQARWSEISNTLPALKDMYDDQVIQNNAVLNQAALYAPNYKVRPNIPGFLYLQMNVYNTYVNNFIKGERGMEETILLLESDSKGIIDTYK